MTPPGKETLKEIEEAIAAVSARARSWYGQSLKRKPGDLMVLQRMLSDGRADVAHIHYVVDVGVAFGDLLARAQGWKWVLVEEDGESKLGLLAGRAAASGSPSTGPGPAVVYPIQMIVEPVEAGRSVDVRELYAATITRYPKR